MAGQSKVGGIAAMVTVVGYVVSTAVLLWGTVTADGNDSNDLAIVVVTWWVGVALGTIAATVAVYSALRRSGGFGGGLSKAAIVVAVLAALASAVLAWAFSIWGLLLSLAMLLLALHLRKSGLGVAGTPSVWDWVIPVAFPLGAATTLALYATVVEEIGEDLEWGYTSGFAIGTLLTAVTMVQVGRWLRSPVEAVKVAETT